MSKWSISLLCLGGALALSPSLHAQALPTATRPGGGIQAGIGATYLMPDYDNLFQPGFHDQVHNAGISIYGDYDFSRWVGVDVEANLPDLVTPNDLTENSYLIGPRVTYHNNRFNKFTVYGKLSFGIGTIKNQDAAASQKGLDPYNDSNSFAVIAVAGGVEYRIKQHYNIRVQAEEQKWRSFEPHTLSPLPITLGVAYVIR